MTLARTGFVHTDSAKDGPARQTDSSTTMDRPQNAPTIYDYAHIGSEFDFGPVLMDGCTNAQGGSSPQGNRPDEWGIGVYDSLKNLLAEAKGACTKPVIRFIREKYAQKLTCSAVN